MGGSLPASTQQPAICAAPSGVPASPSATVLQLLLRCCTLFMVASFGVLCIFILVVYLLFVIPSFIFFVCVWISDEVVVCCCHIQFAFCLLVLVLLNLCFDLFYLFLDLFPSYKSIFCVGEHWFEWWFVDVISNAFSFLLVLLSWNHYYYYIFPSLASVLCVVNISLCQFVAHVPFRPQVTKRPGYSRWDSCHPSRVLGCPDGNHQQQHLRRLHGRLPT